MANAPRRFSVIHARPRRDRRPSACRRGYGRRWRTASQAFLRRNPFCIGYDSNGTHTRRCNRLATCTDHKIPFKGRDDPNLWAANNWQPLSAACHAKKTAMDRRK
jgi:5-methylcytosine-specific restriction endonuclease McrA